MGLDSATDLYVNGSSSFQGIQNEGLVIKSEVLGRAGAVVGISLDSGRVSEPSSYIEGPSFSLC